MKKNPVYRRLLRIEVTLILLLVLCILIVKSCFGPHERDVLQQTQQESMLTEPVVLPDDLSSTQRMNDVFDGDDSFSESAQAGASAVIKENIGLASYYQDAFHGKPTASGESYDLAQYTAAHRKLPFDTQVRVTNIANGRQVTVRINDRGPHKQERIIDLSGQAARAIGLIEAGIAQVKLEVLN